MERTEAFIVFSESENYIVGGKIRADLPLGKAPSHKVRNITGIVYLISVWIKKKFSGFAGG